MATFMVSIPGVASCIIGGVVHLVAWTKGREASQLESVKEIEKLSDLKTKAHHLPQLVAVRGRVWTDSPLKCELTDKPAAIAEALEEQQLMRQLPSGDWVRDQHTVRASAREAPWALEDVAAGKGGHGPTRLPVLNALRCGRISLELAGDRFVSADSSLTKRAMDAITGWRVLGLRHREHILPVGALVTAVGELAASDGSAGGGGGGTSVAPACKGCVPCGNGRVLVLRAPAGGGPFIVSGERLPDMVASLNQVSNVCRAVANTCIAVGGVLIAVKAAQGALLLWRRHKHRRRMEEESRRRRLAAAAGPARSRAVPNGQHASSGAAEHAAGGEREADLCTVCLDREADMAFLGCGHLCVCERCAGSLSRCPLCRTRSRPMKVFRT